MEKIAEVDLTKTWEKAKRYEDVVKSLSKRKRSRRQGNGRW